MTFPVETARELDLITRLTKAETDRGNLLIAILVANEALQEPQVCLEEARKVLSAAIRVIGGAA